MAEQIEALKSLRPDIVALQEVTFRILDSYPPLLSAIGLNYLVNSFDLSKEQDQLKGPRRYGEIIASRWRLSPMKPDLFPVPWKERVLSAKVITPRGNIELHTTHIPPGSSNGWIKIETLEGIYQRLARQAKIPRILCGDFNAPQEERPNGQVVTWGQRISAKGEVHYRKDRGERWDRGERNIILGLAEFDLLDVLRLIHGYTVEGYSWYSNNRGRLRGRRFDHVFASKSLTPTACRYLDEFRKRGLSDHSPIEVDFG